MRTLTHLRHGERGVDRIHLAPHAAARARELGRRWPRFDGAVTSPKPRAVETAEALGYPPDRQLPRLGELPGDLWPEIEHAAPRSFGEYLRLAQHDTDVRAWAEGLSSLLREELERYPEGAHLLVVSHGGIVELGAVGALGAVVERWGPTLGYLEGVRMELDGRVWTNGSVVRSSA